jgi:hypothetical protein
MKSFILSRLRGDAPLHTVFWRDMIIIGTGLNVLSLAALLVLVAAEAPDRWQLAAQLSPHLWNLFVFFAVWRSATQLEGAMCSMIRMAAATWLALMIVV